VISDTTHIKSYSHIVFSKETNTTYTTHILHSFTGPANPRCYCRRHHWASVRSSALSSSWELYLGVVRLQPWAMASIANGIKLLAGWWLTYHLEKYEFVSWNDYPIFFCGKKKNVPNHQPVSHHRRLFLYSASPRNVSGLLGAMLSICVKCMSNGLKLPQFQISNHHKMFFGWFIRIPGWIMILLNILMTEGLIKYEPLMLYYIYIYTYYVTIYQCQCFSWCFTIVTNLNKNYHVEVE
jgi:hypothetical protein